MRQFKYFLRAVRGRRLNKSLVARSLCGAACTWKNLELWKQAMLACQGESAISVLGVSGLEDGVINFGFSNVKVV